MFELYQQLTVRTLRCPVSYRWAWQYITEHRARQTGAGAAEPAPYEHTWAGAAGVAKTDFVTGLITDAVRHLAELAIEGSMSAAYGAELGLASLAAARDRIDQALHELALTGLISGLTPARMSARDGDGKMQGIYPNGQRVRPTARQILYQLGGLILRIGTATDPPTIVLHRVGQVDLLDLLGFDLERPRWLQP
ncbi:hypothetical protein [Streptomyces sp. NPDC102360]|uniref:hypothetical protein n=1 Tax=Streptomyces sp. NPDC102360 TaxID=3366160 RepID=UPI003808F426